MRVLVLEDDPALSAQICAALRKGSYAVDHAADGEEGGFLGETEPYDAIVLDIGLPKRDGLAILRDWRAGGVAAPVLILTARDSWRDKVDGLDAGADDYLAKPFVMAEMLARIRALIRRGAGQADPVLRVGQVEFDTRSKAAFLDGAPVTLTAQEGRVLEMLMLHAGRPLSRTELSEHVYGYDEDRVRTPSRSSFAAFAASSARRSSSPSAGAGIASGAGRELFAPAGDRQRRCLERACSFDRRAGDLASVRRLRRTSV